MLRIKGPPALAGRIRIFAVLASVVAGALLPVVAAASCPPLGPVPRATAALERVLMSTMRRSGPRPSPRDMLDILVRENVAPFVLWPPSGPAPLEVTFKWLTEHVPTTTIEFSADGGPAQPWDSDTAAPLPRRHTYPRPGRYQATVSIREATGRVHRFAQPVDMIDAAAFEADLQSRWSTLKARLRARDVPGALECITARDRDDYRDMLSDVFVRQGKRVDDVLTTIRFSSMLPGSAEYDMDRVEGSEGFSYSIQFRIDVDGVWRLSFI